MYIECAQGTTVNIEREPEPAVGQGEYEHSSWTCICICIVSWLCILYSQVKHSWVLSPDTSPGFVASPALAGTPAPALLRPDLRCFPITVYYSIITLHLNDYSQHQQAPLLVITKTGFRTLCCMACNLWAMFVVDVNTSERVRTFEHIFKHVCTVVHPCQQGTKSGPQCRDCWTFQHKIRCDPKMDGNTIVRTYYPHAIDSD